MNSQDLKREKLRIKLADLVLGAIASIEETRDAIKKENSKEYESTWALEGHHAASLQVAVEDVLDSIEKFKGMI